MPPAAETPPLAGNWAFFLDIDGTLCDFAPVPAMVKPTPRTLRVITALAACTAGAVALVSGRSLQDVVRMFAPLKLAASGQHGLENCDAAGRPFDTRSPSPQFAAVARQIANFASLQPGLLLEDKGLSLSLHYRGAPEMAEQVKAAMQTAATKLGSEYELQRGKLVWEIKPAGINKGSAVEQFMQKPPFSGRIPVFLGDDVTDEYGFAAVNRLGGHAIKVGAGDSQAPWRLADPAAVTAWLEACAAHRGAQTPKPHAKRGKRLSAV